MAHSVSSGMRSYYVYILASRAHVLYVGTTNDLFLRLFRHRHSSSGFAAKYGAMRLVYFESTGSAIAALAREKQIKGWTRARKIALIERDNPQWRDLARGWYE